MDQPRVEYVEGRYWRYYCDACRWTSGTLPFPDPDAAYHAGRCHDAIAHPERIDWPKEVRKLKIQIAAEKRQRGET